MDILTLAQINKLKTSGSVGYSECETVELLSEQTAVEEMPANRCPNAGDEIIVYLNGVAYTQVAKSLTIDGLTGVYIGNGADIGGEETEDVFCLLFAIAEGIPFAATYFYGELAETESITISASAKTVIAHPIDKAFIPFWDIKYHGTDDGVSMTANGENLDLDKAIEITRSGIPSAITTFHNNGVLDSCNIPCGFYCDGESVWMSFTIPYFASASRVRITATGIDNA